MLKGGNMAKRLDWEGAARSDLPAIPYLSARDRKDMLRFINKHDLVCFKCKTRRPTEWGKTGVNARGPWAICLDCFLT